MSRGGQAFLRITNLVISGYSFFVCSLGKLTRLMTIPLTCRDCGTRLPKRALTKAVMCPGCRRKVELFPEQTPAGSPPKKTSRRGLPSPKPQFDGLVVRRGGPIWGTWKLRTRDPSHEWDFRLVGGTVTRGELSEAWWEYSLRGRGKGALAVSPVRRVRTLRKYREVIPRIPPERLAQARRDGERLRPAPLGSTTLETSAREIVVERIQSLAEKKNDPFAWRDLLCGYRRAAIRRPLEKAYNHIGTTKLLAFAKKIGGDWGVDVITYLEAEVIRTRKKPLPAPPSDWHWTDRPYWDD
jgi:hypothetical protein